MFADEIASNVSVAPGAPASPDNRVVIISDSSETEDVSGVAQQLMPALKEKEDDATTVNPEQSSLQVADKLD
jgi:hypothetical protein